MVPPKEEPNDFHHGGITMKKRFLSILATLCLCLTLLPATAMAGSSTTVDVSTWADLQAAIDGNNDAILTSNITWGGSSLTVPTGKNVTLDLNGCKIDAQNQGTAIQVYGTLTINNSGTSQSGMPDTGPAGGAIMNGTATSDSPAGGIYIAPGGQVTMNGGWIALCTTSLSKENTSSGSTEYYGSGGVYISENASFTMNSGFIQDCTTEVTKPSNHITAGGVVNNGTFTIGTFVNITYGYQSTIPQVPSVYNCENGIFTSNSGFVFGNIANKGTIQRTTPIPNDANIKGFAGTVTNRGSITGGKFSGTVTNNNLISGGTFLGTVSNGTDATISNGTFSSEVTNKGSITGGTFSGTVKNSQGTITNGTFTGTVENKNNRMLGRISGGDFSKAHITNGKYTVDVTIGQNMTIRSGDAKQIGLIVQNMTPVVVTADNGYYFPVDYPVDEKDGVKVTRNSASQVTVSGMPCFNVDITLPAATAKTQAAAPSAVFTATGSDTGTLSNVDSGMQYRLDGGNWTDINGPSAELTGLTSSTEIQIIKKGGATATDSAIQTIKLTQAATPTASFAATGTDSGTLNGGTSGMQYRIGKGEWSDITGESAALTGLSKGSVIHVRTKGGGTVLFSQPQDITLEQVEKPTATFTATDASTGTLSGVTTGMKYKIGDGGWNEISSNADISLNDLSACTISVMQRDGKKLDSETQTIQVTKPNAPAASVQNCINGNDGKLTGVDDTMEYRSSGAGSWTAIDGSEVPGLAAGSYEVRYKANGTALASAPQTVTIGSYAAQLTKSNTDVSYYNSLLEAVDAATSNSGSTVKLLQNINVKAYSLVIEDCKNPFTIDLNGKTLSTDIDPTAHPGNLVFYLKNNDAPLTLINSASTPAVIRSQRAFHIQYSGSVIIGKPDGSDNNIKFDLSTMLATSSENTGSITIYGGTFECPVNVSTTANAGVSKVTLYGGTFSQIGVAAPTTLVGTLAEGYAYKDNTNNWVNNPNGNSLTKVTVQKAPVQNLSVTAPEGTVYGQSVSITASPTLLNSSSEVSYKWYQGNTEIAGANESVYTAVGLDAGSYTFRCEVSCDGYITSQSVDLKVNKADCQITPPAAVEKLVYTGKEQALITAGKADGGTMQYSLNGTDWQDTVPVGTNAGTYTVQYQVIGDGNHNNTKPASVSVTIARQPVNVPEPDATVFTYDGEKKTYTIAANDNYTVANAEQTNAGTYTVSVTLKDTKNFVWNDKTDAAKGYTFVIAPAKVTVTIKDKSAYVGSKTAPDLSNPEKDKDYTISGLIGEDTLTGSVKLKYNPATPDLTKVSDMTQITDNGSTLANSNYDVTYVDGKLTVTYRPSSGGSSSGSSTVKTETTKNDDGSTTKTETKKDGTVIETTTGKDGSVTKTETKTETKPDGTKVETKNETETNKDGSKVESETRTETKKDGTVTESKTETITSKDGTKSETKSETKTDKNGVTSGTETTKTTTANGSTGMTVTTIENGESKTAAEAKVSSKAVEDAKKNGEAVKAPVEVEATRNSDTAPTVKVELPKGAGETKVEIPVSNVKPGTVAVLVHPDGTEELLKDSIPTENGIQLTVDGSATVKIIDNSKGFIDTQDHWAKDAIDFVSARGLVNGMSATIYAPNNSTTRAQLWTILARQNDADLNGGNTWFENAQNWAKAKGISDGANPNAAINRAQMVTMLWRAVGQPTAGGTANFTDVPTDSYYAQAVAWAVENGITAGVGGGRFDPTATCTRAQIAAFLARSMK